MGQQPQDSALTSHVRVRLPLPFVIPLVSLAIIGAMTWGFSRVLLSVPKEAATVLALAMAANVLGACAVLALRPAMSRSGLLELLMVVLYPVLIGVAIAQFDIGAGGGHGTDHAAAGAGGGSTVVAEGTAFATDTLTLAAGEANTITFENKDSQPHNIVITSDESGKKELWAGEVITADTVEYEVDPLDKGDYFFHCEVHPAMAGTVTVE
ncbi:MAG: cupredoxin domain-containing protein [Actinomycetota bacterium]|nr:cupredoxin domain-containing protein [Actinomycetota bacterium]